MIRLLLGMVLSGLVTPAMVLADAVGELTGEASATQGRAGYQMHFPVPEGVNDVTPHLGLRYTQGSGNGPLGLGVQLTGLSSISRCVQNQIDDGQQGGVHLDNSDVYCLDGERLFLTSGKLGRAGSEYRLSTTSQTKVVAVGSEPSGPSSWRVYSADGLISDYGEQTSARTQAQGHTLEWKLSKQSDRFTNAITYHYRQDQGFTYLEAIRYADIAIEMDYGTRPDVLTSYQFGQSRTLAQKLNTIRIERKSQSVRTISLRYDAIDSAAQSYTRLASVQTCGSDGSCLPAHRFEWESNPYAHVEPLQSTLVSNTDFKGFIAGDINQNGRQDMCYLDNGLWCKENTGLGQFGAARLWSSDFQGSEWSEPQHHASLSFIDINNSGRLDVCAFNEQGFFCALNQNNQRFEPGRYWSRNFTIDEAVRLLDVNRDGLPDVCRIEASQVVCARNTSNGLSNEFTLTTQGFPLEKTYKPRSPYTDYEPVNLPSPQFVDINGNGFVDLCGMRLDGEWYCAEGTGMSNGLLAFGPAVKWASGLPMGLNHTASTSPSQSQYDRDVDQVEQLARTFTLSDLNSDGLPELCYRNGNRYVCHQNTGATLQTATERVSLDENDWANSVDGRILETSVTWHDRNLDGLADMCYILGERLMCAYGNGTTFSKPEVMANIHPDLEFITESSSHGNWVRRFFGLTMTVRSTAVNHAYGPFKAGIDANGDGLTGDCYRSMDGLACLSYEYEPLAKLKSVTSGLGVTTTFKYGMTGDVTVFTPRSSKADLIGLAPNRTVVSHITQDDGIGGINTTSYHYSGYYADIDDGILGFGAISSDDGRQTLLTTFDFHEDKTPYVSSVAITTGQQRTSYTHYQYQTLPSPMQGKIWPVLREQQNTTWDLNGNLLTQTTTSYQGYDAYGYPSDTTVVTQGSSGPEFQEQTTTTYQHDAARWLIGKPTSIVVTKSNGSDTQSRRSEFHYESQTGALIEQIKAPDHALALTHAFTYNANGFRTSERVSGSGESRSSQTQYDAFGRVIKHTNALGHSVTTQYDVLCALPSRITDANGLSATFEYDAFCREAKRTDANGQWVKTAYHWSDGADAGLDQFNMVLGDRSVFMVTTETSQGAKGATYFDRFGREVRTKQLNSNNKWVMVDIAYDKWGQRIGETVPYFEGLFAGDATYWMRSEFDALGHVTLQRKPMEDGQSLDAKTHFSGLTVTTTLPGGSDKVDTMNANGQTVSVQENGTSTLYYYYDAEGQLIRTDANGLITTLAYDELGNKIQLNDPATGNWTYGYNAFGELIWQQDAKGQKVRFEYDKLGRKVAEVRPEGRTEWTYDAQSKGQLDNTNNPNSQRRYTYNSQGRKTSMTLTLDGIDYLTQYHYDNEGRLDRVTYPSGLNIDRRYDINGALKRLSIPYSEIWDAQYIQLEEALQATAERIIELEVKAHELEQSALFYIEESERLRQAAMQLLSQYSGYQAQANALSSEASGLFHAAHVNAVQAQHYRNKANAYWHRFGNTVFTHYKTENGYAYYKFSRCTNKNWKGNCTSWENKVDRIPAWMVHQNFCVPPGGKLGGFCYSGPSSSINFTQVYNQWAAHYQAIANNYSAQAHQKQSQANHYQHHANQAKAQADKLLAQANHYASLARSQTDTLAAMTAELEDLVEAEKAIQTALDARLDDETDEIVWLATSRDVFGRVSGELFGNGLLTRRELDRARGTTKRITTGMGNQYLRDLRYTFDARNNVIEKVGEVRRQEEHYQYDEFDRLIGWQYSDNNTASYATRDYRYDVYGNLTYKSSQGQFDVKENGQLNGGYTYDANGNMTTGRGRTLSWNSFNKATRVNDNGLVTNYEYGSEKEQIKRTTNGITTYVISPEYELDVSTDASGIKTTTMRHRLFADGVAVAEHIKTLKGSEKQIDRTAYLHRDALGSADLITDPNGQVQLERGYTPFGESIAAAELDANPLFTNAEMRGFTGHQSVGGQSTLINMNARLYDPVIGRFLSADSMVPDPGLSQSYNRYAYVLNNPVKYNDPTGHYWQFVVGAAIALFASTFDNPMIRTVGMVIGSIMMGFGAGEIFSGMASMEAAMASGATVSFTSNVIATGDIGSALQAGVLGGFSAMATWQVGHGIGKDWGTGTQALGHGVVQGGFNELRGGSFRQGFISGTIGKLGGSVVHENFQQSQVAQVGGIVAVSGIAAVASGASSRDAVLRSAISVITVYLYNDLSGMNGIAKISQAKSIMQDADAVATEQTVEFIKEESPGLIADGLTIGAAVYACYQSIGVLCSASASWAAASIDSRLNDKNHILVDVMINAGMNEDNAQIINSAVGLGFSMPSVIKIYQGGSVLDNTHDIYGIGVWMIEYE